MKFIPKFALSSSLLMLASSAFILLLSPSILASVDYTRDDFPPNFVFGSGTSAYQVEGAASEDGRTPSTIDTMVRTNKDFFNGDDGEVTCDQYHKYKEDVELMVDTGLEAYRFSISWSRLIPNGKGPVNPKAVEYYNNLINELLIHGIQPHVTLMHLDPPQALVDAYGGWESPKIVKDFAVYADVCFQEFGDRVLYWTTINELNCYASYFTNKPYILGHNLLLGHASAMNIYKEKYKEKQQGFVGLSVSMNKLIPQRDTKEDLIAVERVKQFTSGWFIHPLVYGDYPDAMKQNLGSQLPSFSDNETKLVRGSFDFIGINTYRAFKVQDNPSKSGLQANCHSSTDGGEKILQDVLEYFKDVYGNPPVFVHENGYITLRNASLHDTARVDYLQNSIGSLLDATRNGSNVKGYFQWSFLDLFEIPGGYECAYGLYFVDLDDPDLRRYPKLSAHWYSAFLKSGTSSSMVLQSASWKLFENRERKLLEENRKFKTFLNQGSDYSSICYCTVDQSYFTQVKLMI